MRKLIPVILALAACIQLHSQGIGIGTTTPNASAQLDITSTTKGILIPRMTSAQRTAIVSPATGLMVFDTNTNGFWFYNGSSWINLATSVNSWSTTGNTGTNPSTHYIGTNDMADLRFKINTFNAGLLSNNGNVFFGWRSNNNNSTTFPNTAIGGDALSNNTTGNFNVALGNSSLRNNTTGYFNTAIGGNVMMSNTTGFENTALGKEALLSNESGYDNTAVGLYSLYSNTTGNTNTAIGVNAMALNTTGYSNVAIGIEALKLNTSRSNLVAVGDSALFNNTTGSSNTAIGSKTLYANTLGNDNTATGYAALYSNVNGFSNTANGFKALYSNTSAAYNSALGYRALYTNSDGYFNTAMGYEALGSNVSGLENTASGYKSLYSNTSHNNTAMGSRSMENNNSGIQNTAVGAYSFQNNTSGSRNTAIGHGSLYSIVSGDENSGLGFSTYVVNGGSNASAIGARARADCSNCMVLGSVSGVNGALSDINIGIGQNTPGFPLNFKSSLGDKVSFYGNSGNHYGVGIQPNLMQIFTDYNGADIGFGFGSSSSFTETMRIKGNGNLNVNGSINTDQANINNGASAPGLSFGSASGEAISSKRTAGGNQYGMDFYTNFLNRMSITNGGNVGIGISNPQSTLHLGNGAVLKINDLSGTRYGQVFYSNGGNLHIDAFGGGTNYIGWYGGFGLQVGNGTAGGYGPVNAAAFIVTSSALFKKNINNTRHGLPEILQLQGKEYSYIFDKDSKTELGLIAEEVEKILPEVVYRDSPDHRIMGIDYGKLVPVLIEAIKQQQKQIDELKKRVDAMPHPLRQ